MGRHLSAPWDELQIERGRSGYRSFRLVFLARTSMVFSGVPKRGTAKYTSKWYPLRKGEDAVRAARKVCEEYGWDKRNPATEIKG